MQINAVKAGAPRPLNSQKWCAFALAYLVSFQAILSCLNAILNLIGLNTGMDTLLCYALLWGSLAVGAGYLMISRGIKVDVLLLFAGVLAVFMITLVAFPENREYMLTSFSDYAMNPIFVLFLYALPGYLFARYLEDYSVFIGYMRIFSYLTVCLSAFVFFFLSDSFAAQYMTLSYNMLLQTAFLLFYSPGRLRALHWIVVLLGGFVILVGGARGAMLGLFVALLLRLFGKSSAFRYKKVALLIGFFSLALLLLFFDRIVLSLIDLLERLDMSSRTLELLISDGGGQDFSSGRGNIYEILAGNLRVFGSGMYGDRVLLSAVGSSYAHNLFLELLTDYGVLFGTLLSLAIVLLIVIGLFRANRHLWSMIVVFIPNGLVALLFSGSYLGQFPAFYALLGFCATVLLRRRDQIDTRLEKNAN